MHVGWVPRLMRASCEFVWKKEGLVRRSASPVIYNICCVYVVYVLCISSGFPLDSKGKDRAPCIYSGLKMFFLFLKRMLPESTRYTMDMLQYLCECIHGLSWKLSYSLSFQTCFLSSAWRFRHQFSKRLS